MNAYLEKFTVAGRKPVEKKKGEPRNWRDEAISEIVEKVNQSRIGTKFKPVTPAAIAVRLEKLKKQDIDYLLKRARESDSFSRTFFGLLKFKKPNEG